MKPKNMFPAWKLAELHTVVMYGKEKRLISLLMYSARRADLGHRVTSLRRQKGAVFLQEFNVKRCTVAIHISKSAFSKCIFQLKARNFCSRISHRGLNQSIFAKLPGANSGGMFRKERETTPLTRFLGIIHYS